MRKVKAGTLQPGDHFWCWGTEYVVNRINEHGRYPIVARWAFNAWLENSFAPEAVVFVEQRVTA